MKRLRVFRLIISIAALVFIAKPFLGFDILSRQPKSPAAHTILVKSFTKRKIETQEEVNDRANILHHLLANPSLLLLSSIALFLSVLLPLVIQNSKKLTRKLLTDIQLSSLPPEQAYLLTGKLTI